MNAARGRSVPPSIALSSSRWAPISRAEVVTVALLAALVLWLVSIALSGDRPMVDWLTSEDGPLEWTSVIAWLVLATVIIATAGMNRYTVLLAAVCLLFCARELDLHKQALFGSVSFLKINFYRGHEVTLTQKLFGGLIALGVLGTVLGGLGLNTLAFLRRRLYRRPWGRLVVLAGVLLVLSKVFDRLPAVLADEYHRPLGWTATALAHLHEEGLETFVPLLLIAIAWLRVSDAD